MAGASRSNARWIALILGVTLVASAVVAYALVNITAPGADTPTVVSSMAQTTGAPAGDTVASADGASGVSGTLGPATSPTPPASQSPPVTSTVPSASTTAATAESTGPPTSPAATTATSLLAGSGVMLPAAWSGTAKVTVTVLGECATKVPSVYSDIPADLALDLTQNEASVIGPTASADLPTDEPTVTLGINTSGVPSLAVYSSTVDESGKFHRFWRLQLTPGAHRTEVHGTLVGQAQDGTNPNIMVDAETSLQPCEAAGTVALPRVLADGSTMTGWVSSTRAQLTLTATTTDGKRAVTVVVTASRQQ